MEKSKVKRKQYSVFFDSLEVVLRRKAFIHISGCNLNVCSLSNDVRVVLTVSWGD